MCLVDICAAFQVFRRRLKTPTGIQNHGQETSNSGEPHSSRLTPEELHSLIVGLNRTPHSTERLSPEPKVSSIKAHTLLSQQKNMMYNIVHCSQLIDGISASIFFFILRQWTSQNVCAYVCTSSILVTCWWRSASFSRWNAYIYNHIRILILDQDFSFAMQDNLQLFASTFASTLFPWGFRSIEFSRIGQRLK